MVNVIEIKEVKEGIGRITRNIEGVLNRFQEIEFAYLFGSFLERKVFNDIDAVFEVLQQDLGVLTEFERAVKRVLQGGETG
jgi:predicted nucleotidyltransferase